MENNNFFELLERSDKDQLTKMIDAMLTIEYRRHMLQPIISSIKEKLLLKSEEDVVKYIDALNQDDISDRIKVLLPREMMIKELNDLSPEIKEGLVNYYKRKKKAKVERGILSINSSNELTVSSPMHNYKISKESLLERSFKSDEKVLGVVKEGVFNILEELELSDGKKMFGYIVKNDLGNSTLKVQTIEGFHRPSFDPFNAECNFGEEVVIKKEDVLKLSLHLK